MTNDALIDTFFAECEELIESLIANLDQISAGEWDKETVNGIFRAVHSIKGAAGAFGFSNLVDFAHHYETVLDLIRSDKLAIEGDVLRLAVRSADILAELVDCARDDSAPPDVAATISAELVTLVDDGDGEEDQAFYFTPAPLEFAPLAIPIETSDAFEVCLKPNAEMYLSGHDPYNLINGLEKKGTIEVECNIEDVPGLDNFDFDESYMSWTIHIADVASEGELHDVFQFVDGLCDLTITPTSAAASDPIDQLVAAGSATLDEVPPDPSMVQPNSAPENTPSSPAIAAPATSAAVKPVQTTLRVDPERVDRLINSVGELIINHAVIDRNLQEAGLISNSEMTAALDDYGNLAREIQDAVMSIRAQPVKSLFQRMGRVVREAGEATQKPVQFVTEGETTEIDKTMLERLADPLVHMLRNAVDHGIEKPEQRSKAGKAPAGIVRLSASHRSGHVVIEISDDGAGLNRDRILAKAIEKKIIAPDANPPDSEVYALLFAPGFSTADNVTNLSGRGVGMDVVKTAITSLGGKVGISSVSGEGTVFSISLPLTLAVLDGMIVEVGRETMVLPLSSVIETLRPKPHDVQEVGPGEFVLAMRGSFVTIVDLKSLFGFADAVKPNDQATYVLVETNTHTIAVAVEAIQDQRQVVIKSLKGNYGSIKGISAATILGDGNIALIVDPDALLESSSRAKAPKNCLNWRAKLD